MKHLVFLSALLFIGCGSGAMVVSGNSPDNDANCDCDAGTDGDDSSDANSVMETSSSGGDVVTDTGVHLDGHAVVDTGTDSNDNADTSNDTGTGVDTGVVSDASASNDASGDSGLCEEERNDPSPYCERQLHCCMDQCKTIHCSAKHTTCVHKCEEQHKECVATIGGSTQ